jgi:hypothetical protein
LLHDENPGDDALTAFFHLEISYSLFLRLWKLA